MPEKTINVRLAGLGGQGIIRASDILAEVAFRAGCDVKKSELHGMSQRGGSVSSDVRFGTQVWSPMIPKGQTDYLVIVSPDQVENNRPALKPQGVLVTPALIPENDLPNKKTLNLALLGALSAHLPFSEELWLGTIQESFAESFFAANEKAFKLGRQLEKSTAK
jgi:indolepyruvate ferredoxin oxidoreductase beta subunit